MSNRKQSGTHLTAWQWLVLGTGLITLLTWFNGRPEARRLMHKLFYVWPESVGLFHVPWDKFAHALAFGGITLIFGLSAGSRRRWLVILFMVAYAVFDELRQMFLPGRDPDVVDFATDVLAIITAIWVVLPRLPHWSARSV